MKMIRSGKISGSGGNRRTSIIRKPSTPVTLVQLRRSMYPILEKMGIPKDSGLNTDHQVFKAQYINDVWQMVHAGLRFTLEKIPYSGRGDWSGDPQLDTKEPPYGILAVPVSSSKGRSALEMAHMKRLYISIAKTFKKDDLQIINKVVLHKLIEAFVTGQKMVHDTGNDVMIKIDLRWMTYLQHYRRHCIDQNSPLYQFVSVKQRGNSRNIEIWISPMIDGGNKNRMILMPTRYQEFDFFPA
jgi:hypothetical protein